MSKIKCVENKGYKITVDQEYDIVRSDREFYFVQNDNDKLARYSKSLFQPVRVAPTPPPPPRRTERDMIASIGWNATTRVLTYNNIANNVVSIPVQLSFSGTNISCGVNQCYNVDGLIESISSNVSGDDDYIELQKALLTRALQEDVKNKTNVAMTLMSTTTDDEDMIPVIDAIADVTSAVRRNPNSRNNIKTWIFYVGR